MRVGRMKARGIRSGWVKLEKLAAGISGGCSASAVLQQYGVVSAI